MDKRMGFERRVEGRRQAAPSSGKSKKIKWAAAILVISLTLFFRIRAHREESEDSPQEAASNSESGLKAEKKTFIVQKSDLVDTLDGLMGTVKGDTLSLAFG